MPLIKYQSFNFSKATIAIIARAIEIINEYASDGYDLTLRQLYYQFVSRELIENKQSEYKRLGSIINDARLSGLIDWDSIVDRTRNLQSNPHWESPSEIIESCTKQYRIDMWEGQTCRPEVWIEKDALVGVIEGVCKKYDVPFFSCRGYTSQSEMWAAGQRFIHYEDAGQEPIVFHLGDHDPSGIDMSRDIESRLRIFRCSAVVRRIALNSDQVKQYRLPANPCKLTDVRSQEYIALHGYSSWELDALDPKVITKLIEANITEIIDAKPFKRAAKKWSKDMATLRKIAKKA